MGVNAEERIFRTTRNLEDAGCNRVQIAKFLELEEQQKRKEQYRMLKQHKAFLLEELHQDQYKIDCLDHMVYTMEKEDKQNGGFHDE